MVATAASSGRRSITSIRSGSGDGDEHHIDVREIDAVHGNGSEALGSALRKHRLVDVAERNPVPELLQRRAFRMADHTRADGEHMEPLERRLRTVGDGLRHDHAVSSNLPPRTWGSSVGNVGLSFGRAYGQAERASR